MITSNGIDCAALIQDAIAELEGRDLHLARAGVREESISHRIACAIESILIMEERIGALAVDVEYNRHRHDFKDLNAIGAHCQEFNPNQTARVQPDIIVHERTLPGTAPEVNRLIVEVKRHHLQPADYAWALCKLRYMTQKPGDYEYEVGLCLCFDTSEQGFSNWTQVWVSHGCKPRVEGFCGNEHLLTSIGLVYPSDPDGPVCAEARKS